MAVPIVNGDQTPVRDKDSMTAQLTEGFPARGPEPRRLDPGVTGIAVIGIVL